MVNESCSRFLPLQRGWFKSETSPPFAYRKNCENIPWKPLNNIKYIFCTIKRHNLFTISAKCPKKTRPLIILLIRDMKVFHTSLNFLRRCDRIRHLYFLPDEENMHNIHFLCTTYSFRQNKAQNTLLHNPVYLVCIR